MPFDHKNFNDLHILQTKVTHFQKCLNELQAIDRHLGGSTAVFLFFYHSSYWLFSLVSETASWYGMYNFGLRVEASKRYTEALDDLLKLYPEVMGKDTGFLYEKLALKPIQDLIMVVGPWLKAPKTWQDSDLNQRPGEELKEEKPQEEKPQEGIYTLLAGATVNFFSSLLPQAKPIPTPPQLRKNLPQEFLAALNKFEDKERLKAPTFLLYGEGGGLKNLISIGRTTVGAYLEKAPINDLGVGLRFNS